MQEIMDSIQAESGVKYLVKWQGYPARKWWTWEPYEHFFTEGAKHVVREFHDQHPGKPKDKRARGRS